MSLLGFINKQSRASFKLLALLFLAVLLAATNGCEGPLVFSQQNFEQLKNRKLTVITTQNPLIYEPHRYLAHGFEQDLLHSFAQKYDLKIEFKPYASFEKALEAFHAGQGQIFASRIWAQAQQGQALLGPAFDESKLTLFCRKSAQVEKFSDLKGKKIIAHQFDRQRNFEDFFKKISQTAQMKYLKNKKPREAFLMLRKKQADCVISETSIGALYIHEFTEVSATKISSDRSSIHWLLARQETDLQKALFQWSLRASRSGQLMQLRDLFEQSLVALSFLDLQKFHQRVETYLPQYLSEFKLSSQENKLDWRFVAAVAYQESHWEEQARSFTGVRGLMQLTKDTAERVGIDDRLDPVQSIWGGASYLRELINKIPKNIPTQERLALALAAYNSGFGHLLDVQQIAKQRGLNPYSWNHLKSLYPLLEEPEMATQLTYGLARGSETVKYVDRALGFYNVLVAKNSY